MRLIPLRLWALALVSGLLQVLPFPIAGPLPVWRSTFAWIALLPLLYALTSNDKQDRPLTTRQGTLLGYACGVVWYLGNCYWIFQTMNLYGGLPQPVAAIILLLFSLYLGLYHAFFAAIVAALNRSAIGKQGALLLVPFAWVAVELARARITSFPWDLLGYTQVDNPLLTQLAPVTGVYGLSFVIAAINALWLVRIRIRERPYTRIALTLAGVAIIALYTLAVRKTSVPQPLHPNAHATLVQENLEVGAAATGPAYSQQQLLESFTYLSRHPGNELYLGTPGLRDTPKIQFATRPNPVAADIIVWPESPAGFLTSDPAFIQHMHALADSTRTPLIIGSIGIVQNTTSDTAERVARPYLQYDSATYFLPGQPAHTRYDKIHLVPFGEYVPFKDLIFFARKLTAGVGDMDRGANRNVVQIGGHAFGTFICYESIFGDEVRLFVRNGANVLVTISDDGWYGDTGAPWQHQNMVRMRAIENHRWVLRSTNTGITAVINPLGKVVAAAPRHQRTAISVGFGYEQGTTFYTAHGDLFAYACSLLTLLALAYSYWGNGAASGRRRIT